MLEVWEWTSCTKSVISWDNALGTADLLILLTVLALATVAVGNSSSSSSSSGGNISSRTIRGCNTVHLNIMHFFAFVHFSIEESNISKEQCVCVMFFSHVFSHIVDTF